MSQSNGSGKGGRSRASAARTEKSPKGKTLKFAGLTFKLPAMLPDTILFDMAIIEAAGENPMPMFRMLLSILGQEQFNTLRSAVESGQIKTEELDEFIASVFEKYGVTAGESSASQVS